MSGGWLTFGELIAEARAAGVADTDPVFVRVEAEDTGSREAARKLLDQIAGGVDLPIGGLDVDSGRVVLL